MSPVTESPLERLLPEMRRGVLQIAILTMLREKIYGYALSKNLAEGGFPVEEGTLYPILRRFEQQGLVHAIWDTSGPRPRKYYQATTKGNSLLDQLKLEWQEIADALRKILKQSERKTKK